MQRETPLTFRQHSKRLAFRMAIAAVCAIYMGSALGGAALAQNTTPITHVVFLVKENRSFDNIFGTFPGLGADGTTSGQISTGQILPLAHAPDVYSRDMCHTWNCNVLAFDGGRMDKWDVTVGDATFACNLNGDYLCYSQYNMQSQATADLPNYFTYANTFTLASHYFSGIHATSNPNHMYTVAATSNGIIGQAHLNANGLTGESGCQSDPGSSVNVLADNGDILNPFPCFDFTVLTDSLEAAGLTWAYYTPSGSSYNPLEAINHIRNNPLEWSTHIKDEHQFAVDAASGNLPNVAWLVTDDNVSEHPPNSMCNGENWDTQQINALMAGDWLHTAAFLLWDDSGGLYDHVPWPTFDQYGPGPRVPMVIISPYALPGHISTTTYEHSSLVKFAESIFGLQPIHSRDMTANDMLDSFDFNQTPISALNLSTRACSPASQTTASFLPLAVGTSSPAKTVTISNFSSVTLTINKVQITGADFTQTNTCSAPLPPVVGTGKIHSCTVNVTFKPTATGPRTGTLTITDTDPASPQIVALSGTGTNVSLTPSLASFGSVSLGSSKTLTATLKNLSTSTLSIVSVNTTGDYSQTNTCGSSLGAGASCTLSVTFTPVATGLRFGTLNISDSDGSSPQTLNLTGSGSDLVISPASITFPIVNVGSTSAPKTVTFTNNGNNALTFTSIVTQGTLQQTNSDFFIQTTTCGSSLAAHASCTVNVVLTPSNPGVRAGDLVFFDSETTTSPQTVLLTGTGSSNAIPLLSDPLVPSAAAPGGAQFTLTVNGSGFVSGSAVKWNGTSLATTFVSASKLTAIVPATNIATAGTALVRVSNPTPLGGLSNAAVFEITAGGAPPVLTKKDFPVGTAPLGLVRDDFNGDGILDIAVVNSGTNTVSAALGNGVGGLTLTSTTATGVGPTAIVSGDFNGDGKVDLAVTFLGNATVQPGVTVLLGNGNGTFTAAAGSAPQTGAGPVAAITADFDNDGRLNIVTANNIENLGSVLEGNGDGTFDTQATGPNTGNGPISIAAGDFNGDGFVDLAIVNNLDNTFSLLPGNDDGSFTWSGVTPTGNGPSSIAAADFNGDGFLDLAVSNKTDNTISVFLGSGTGTFTLQSTPATGSGPNSIAVGDFNGDGKLDLTTANSSSNTVSILLGNGDGTFQAHADSPTSSTPSAIVTGDFDRDGKLDVAVSNTGANTVSFLTQVGSGNVPAVTLSPTSLTFPTQLLNTTSAGMNVTLTNSGTATLTITSIAPTGTNAGDFSQTNTCGSSVAAGASCTITVTFTPKARGNRTANISITDNASGSPQTVPLSGAGTVVQLVPPSLTFGTVKVGTKSTPMTITLTNTGGSSLSFTGISFTGTNAGDFSKTTTCSTTTPLPAGGTCTISVTFKPTATGLRSANLNVIDNGGGSPQLVPLSGTGN